MSTATATATATYRPPALGRLTRVELRKMTDTRAGLWLGIAIALLTLGLPILVAAVGKTDDHVYREMLNAAVQPASLLLPIVGILLVTSEWTQRTTLTTFSLVPRRGRVIVAKVLASIALALVAFAVAMACAALGTALAGDGTWALSGELALQMALSLVVSTLIGVAFGAVLLSSAPAIVLYFALPTVWAILTQSIRALQDVGLWLDLSQTMGAITEHAFSGKEWARLGTSLLLWLVLPLAAGTWRILRSEVK